MKYLLNHFHAVKTKLFRLVPAAFTKIVIRAGHSVIVETNPFAHCLQAAHLYFPPLELNVTSEFHYFTIVFFNLFQCHALQLSAQNNYSYLIIYETIKNKEQKASCENDAQCANSPNKSFREWFLSHTCLSIISKISFRT